MTWTITDSSGSVIIRNPQRMEFRAKAVISAIEIPSTAPFILGLGKEADQLNIGGTLVAEATSNLVAMHGMVFKQCSIKPHRNFYSGDWICVDFSAGEEGGTVDIIPYNMSFIRGSEMLTLE